MARKRVLVVLPNRWDRRQLEHCREDWQHEFEVLYAEPSAEWCPVDLDVRAHVNELVANYAGRIEGVLSSNDHGASIAAAVGTALRLPSPRPEAVLKTTHKYYSRIAQRECVPEATAEFWLIDARRPGAVTDLPYPVFVKPVKGSFSVHARQIDSAEELRAFLDRPAIREFTDQRLALFNRMATEDYGLAIDGHYFLAERLLHGPQVTVEGYCAGGRVTVYGIVDSVFHPGTHSFARFDYPSNHAPHVLARMRNLAERVIPHLGLQPSSFNMEVKIDPGTGTPWIVEINPRLCGQFADLYDKVNGWSSFVDALRIATGEVPGDRAPGQGRDRVASSFPLRIFAPSRVVRAPTEEETREVEAEYPGSLMWNECETGSVLEDFSTLEDGTSIRYAVLNLGGASWDELDRRRQQAERRLDYRFAPL